MVTETLIRGMYRYWREVMESDPNNATPADAGGNAATRPGVSTSAGETR
jgi:hypothetical protein